MSVYDRIKESVEACITVLEEEHFSDGSTLDNMQQMVCNIAKNIDALNDYVKTIDDRVTILEI